MSDPYQVLGVPPTATDDEVKAAYRELAKSTIRITMPTAAGRLGDRENEGGQRGVRPDYGRAPRPCQDRLPAAERFPAAGRGAYAGYSSSSSFYDVRNLIMNGRIADAEQILNGVPTQGRNAEWFFLKGTVLYKRGWLDEAYNHFTRAVQLDPGNAEYRSAMNQVTNQRRGNFGGYNPGGQVGGCTACDVCNGLICADCCCECMGGDLISCC